MRALLGNLKEKDIPYRTDVSATTLCTFRIGGTVALVIEPRCIQELYEACALCRAARYPFEILGNGSNVLFEDGYLPLAVVRTKLLDACRLLPWGIWAECGAPLPRLCHVAAANGRGGLGFACGIPATLGGALAMNAGAHGGVLSDVVKSVKLLNVTSGEIKTDVNFKNNALYRNGGFKDENTLILGAELELNNGFAPEQLLAEIKRLRDERRARQPVELPSAGCVFRRPHPWLPIGKLLDELGCKGMRVGGAEVSQKHAAFIVNIGNATAADVKALMREIEKKAEKERGMTLTSEIRIISGRV